MSADIQIEVDTIVASLLRELASERRMSKAALAATGRKMQIARDSGLKDGRRAQITALIRLLSEILKSV
jgi:hypothetical protein